MVANLIVLLGAGIIGWFLAGEPKNIDELKSGIGHLFGGHHHGGGAGDYRGGGYPPMMGGGGYPPMMGGGPPGSSGQQSPDVQALQQQMQQQQQQAQMQQMQQQFQEQMSQQSAAAQQAQMQQQMQQIQQQAQQAQQAAAMGGAGAMGSASGVAGATATNPATGIPSPITNPATATPATADAAQQMLPSAIAPGIVPGTQQQPYNTSMGTPVNPYGQQGTGYPIGYNPYAPGTPQTGAYGIGQLDASGMPAPAYPGGPPPLWATPGFGGGGGGGWGGTSPVDTMFAGHYAPPLGPINVQGPLRAIPNHTVHRGFLGIIDNPSEEEQFKPRPFFHGYHDLMQINLGPIVPGLDGILLGDLIASSDSGTGNEIFPTGIDKMRREAFISDVIRYVNRILRGMTGKSPQVKMRILRELILEASRAKGISSFNPIPPNVVTYQNILSSIPHRNLPDIIPHFRGPRYRNHAGYTIPDKYASLQFKGGNSMPPMIHQGHSLYFDE